MTTGRINQVTNVRSSEKRLYKYRPLLELTQSVETLGVFSQ